MKTATKGQAVRQFPGPAYVNREEIPQPEPTMQETQQPTERPTPTRIETPKSKPTPTRIKPKWLRRPYPTATLPEGSKTPPRWRRTPTGTPSGGPG
jgi:hypothetical protein